MRLRRRALSKVADMGPRELRITAASLRLAAGLHDVSGDLAIGIALLKGWKESGRRGSELEPDYVLKVFEQVLTELRLQLRTVTEGAFKRRPPSVRESLELEANITEVELDFSLVGKESSLSGAQAELIRLAGREAIRNVKRHSGVSRCRLMLDLSSCPFLFTARDWGGGIQPRARLGSGIALLEALADELGAALAISSKPGEGVELTVTGPLCVIARNGYRPVRRQSRLRSVVADESPGSRKTLVLRRPIEALGQQIT